MVGLCAVGWLLSVCACVLPKIIFLLVLVSASRSGSTGAFPLIRVGCGVHTEVSLLTGQERGNDVTCRHHGMLVDSDLVL